MRIKFLFFLLFLPVFLFAQEVPLSGDARISVLTCGIGNEVYSLFGHTAIRIQDPQTHLDVVYNYGAFDFEAPNFILRFSKGDLQYFVTAENFDDFMYQYYYEKRSVYEQELYLSEEQKQQVFETLNETLSSDARYYTYKFIDRNCTNMAVDLLNGILGGKVIRKTGNTAVTYRETLYPYFNSHFYEQLGTSIIFGTKVDQKATLLFLPVELQNSLAVTNYKGAPIASTGRMLLNYSHQKTPFSPLNNGWTFLLLLILIVVINRYTVAMVYFGIIGAIGLFFSVAGFYSYHEELAWNYNALLFNPALLLLIWFYLRRNAKWTYYTAVFCIATIGIYLLVMIGKIHIFIVAPVVMANLILLGRFAMKAQSGFERIKA
ncbi:MAG: DUF4105 domain-containing protein [Flavobacterium sp.]|nr:MAG: DUF4105 domain-containing protein [Flavobacterium sp.]